MDSNKNLGPNSIAEEIFNSYFKTQMSFEDLSRALNIFRSVSQHNERSIAIQFFAAVSHGKLEEVLEAYEIFTGPRGYLGELDEVTRAVEVRHFADFIYLGVIAGGDQQLLFDQAYSVEIPEIFDNMQPPLHRDSQN